MIQGALRSAGLRKRLVLTTVGLIGIVTLCVSLFFIVSQQLAHNRLSEGRAESMRDALRKRGTGLARNVALASERAIAVMDFLFLTEVINSTVGNDDEIAYGILMDEERRALVHSNPEFANRVLKQPEDFFAAQQEQSTTQELQQGDLPIMEVIAPIHVAGKRWGTIRFGMLLTKLHGEITQEADSMRRQQLQNVVMATLTALVLVLLGSGGAAWIAARIAQPLQILMTGVSRIREGNLTHTVTVEGASEFVDLAHAFNGMTTALNERDAALKKNMAELEEALKKAEEASRLKSEFLANVSHELRTPLNAIVNVPGSLLREYKPFEVWHCGKCNSDFHASEDPTEQQAQGQEACAECGAPGLKLIEKVFNVGDAAEHRHFLKRLLQSGQHLLNVVNDLLDFSKLEAGHMLLHREPVALSEVFSEIKETMEPLASEKSISVEYPTVDDAAVIPVDRLKLIQILINLIGNAIKFTASEGAIQVGFDGPRDGQHNDAHFFVQDNGIGIAADKLDLIFESFRQADGSHTRSHGGTGLGLAITKQLVELHGGKIWAESTVNEGSIFHFVLPCTDDAVLDHSPVQADESASPMPAEDAMAQPVEGV